MWRRAVKIVMDIATGDIINNKDKETRDEGERNNLRLEIFKDCGFRSSRL